MLSPRTVLNGGKRQAGARACQKSRIRRRLKIHPRTNLNGGDLVRSTFQSLLFPFTLAFMATLVLALILAFVVQRWKKECLELFFCRCRARLKLRRSSIHLVLIGDSPVREKRWDNNLGVTNKHKKQDSKPQHKQPKTQNQKGHLRSKVKHYAFRKVPMPLSTAPRWCSKYHS